MTDAFAFVAQAVQPAASDSAVAAQPTPWWWQYVYPIILLAVGAFVGNWFKYKFDRLLPTQRVKRRELMCYATYCPGLLTPSADNVGDDLEVRLDGKILPDPVVINYRMENTGDVAVTDVNVRVETAKADRIIRWKFYLYEEVQRERFETVEESERVLRFRWKYINPKDVITLVLLVAPCKDATCVHFEVDAMDVSVHRGEIFEDCAVMR